MLKTVGNPSTRYGDQTILDGNLVIGTAGKGIDFSVTSSGSGTMTSELFDDYEEGTFTPDVKFGGGNTGLTYFARNGSYTKVGNVVHFRIGCHINSVGSSTGAMTIDGLPFASQAGSYFNYPGSIIEYSFTGLTGAVKASVIGGAASVELLQSGATGESAITQVNGTGYFMIFGSYIVP